MVSTNYYNVIKIVRTVSEKIQFSVLEPICRAYIFATGMFTFTWHRLTVDKHLYVEYE
jgi:hypothetical protein